VIVVLRTRMREMGQIIVGNWDIENFVCESIYHPQYGRYESRSGV
jgi:hypothetical protein